MIKGDNRVNENFPFISAGHLVEDGRDGKLFFFLFLFNLTL